jgi:hypothetical protein
MTGEAYDPFWQIAALPSPEHQLIWTSAFWLKGELDPERVPIAAFDPFRPWLSEANVVNAADKQTVFPHECSGWSF